MKLNKFQTLIPLIAATLAFSNGLISAAIETAEHKKEIYEWRVYHFENGGQPWRVDQYYRDCLIPTLNEYGVKVGAFGEYGQTEPPTIYFLIVYPSLSDYQRIKNELWQNDDFLKKSKSYFNETADGGAYTRFESHLLEAFDGLPTFRQPPESRGLFELRTYESHNEEAGQRKIAMFNREELPLFDKVGLHPVFFGEVLAGPQMPALVYLLWFEDMEERNANWKKFVQSEEWNTMKVKPEYANTVSVVNKVFLLPKDYSQL